MHQKPENIIIRPNQRKNKVTELNFWISLLCCANINYILSDVVSGQFLFGGGGGGGGRAQVTETNLL